MKKFFYFISAILIASCSSDSDEIKSEFEQESGNNQPEINDQAFQIDEHSAEGTSVGIVTATDKDGDDITFTIDSESGLEINENTGELTLGNNIALDFETAEILAFTVSAFDGKSIIEKDFILNISNVNEFDLLTDIQKETVSYFKYLALWQGPHNTPIDQTSKWAEPMKIFLDGTISNEFKINVENVLQEINGLTTEGSFEISLVETLDESNTHLFFGEANELETLWPDMYQTVNGQSYSGYASTNGTISTIQSARIWISNPIGVLFKHELGHSIGLGHSNLCDTENSFMCSSIDLEHEILPAEQDILRYMYHDDMPGGLTESELESYLANIIMNE